MMKRHDFCGIFSAIIVLGIIRLRWAIDGNRSCSRSKSRVFREDELIVFKTTAGLLFIAWYASVLSQYSLHFVLVLNARP